MYVILPASWFDHTFLTNKFVIKTRDRYFSPSANLLHESSE
jgi:hypothetical protein